jgi:hypothetical protein
MFVGDQHPRRLSPMVGKLARSSIIAIKRDDTRPLRCAPLLELIYLRNGVNIAAQIPNTDDMCQ